MKIILSTNNYQDLKTELQKAKDIAEVYKYLMSIKYFCFISIENKKQLYKFIDEASIYKSIFNDALNITVIHNSQFYEEEGISKLNYWEYFRNIKEIKKTDYNEIIENKEIEKIESLKQKIVENDFNKKEILKLKL